MTDFVIKNMNGEVAFRLQVTDDLLVIRMADIPPPRVFYCDRKTARELRDWLDHNRP